MTATNHAVTGALIGLLIADPVLAVSAAFCSHFVLDGLPHYGAKTPDKRLLKSRRYVLYLAIEASLCLVLVLILAISQPRHWWLAAICAFLAASPDFMWLPRFLAIRHSKPEPKYRNWLIRLHRFVQWSQTPAGGFVEVAWLLVMSTLLAARIMAMR